jgi:hypothetical protein
MSFITSIGNSSDSVPGKMVDPADQNASGALCKFQADSYSTTTLVQQAAEQNLVAIITRAQQTTDQKPGGSTNLIQQAVEQNPRDNEIRAVEFAPGNFLHFDKKPAITPIQQADEQNARDNVIRNVENILGQNFKQFDGKQPATNLVEQAAEQNTKDHVIRNVEAILSQNSKNIDYEEPPTNYVQQAVEQTRDNTDAGISKFFSKDLETNLMDNASYVLTRGNALKLLTAKPTTGFSVGAVGELQGLDPADFWHSQNDKADLSKYVKQSVTAAKQLPESVDKAIEALEQRIDQNLKDVKSGKTLDVEQKDRMRQMAENAALIKLAVAETQDPKAAKNLVLWNDNSVVELIRIAERHGANKDNVQQLKKMVDDFNKR